VKQVPTKQSPDEEKGVSVLLVKTKRRGLSCPMLLVHASCPFLNAERPYCVSTLHVHEHDTTYKNEHKVENITSKMNLK
jgi:hypothetical protein